MFAVRSKEVGGGFGSFPLALTFDMLCFLEVWADGALLHTFIAPQKDGEEEINDGCCWL